jgi:hypothetical protein
MNTDLVDLRPAGYDKHGPKWLRSDVEKAVVRRILSSSDYFTYRAKQMNDDVAKATEITEGATKRFSQVLHEFDKTHVEFSNSAKKASSSVRVAADAMASGLLKIERTANFDRLERMVGLLERAATAMTTMAELEKGGQLKKISEAIK